MMEENIDIPLAVEVSGDEGSQDESFDIPVLAVAEISEPEDIIEEITDIPIVVEVSENEGSQDKTFDVPTTMEVNEPESCNVEVIVDINTPKFRPRIFSRYLSPHTGSCHDFCKYGAKDSFEGKLASPVLRKAKSVRGDGQDLRRIIVSLAKQNKDAINSKSSPDYNAIDIAHLKEYVISSPEIVTPSPKRLLPSIKEVQAAAVHYSRTKLNLSLSKASSLTGQGSSRTKRNKEVRKGKKQDRDGSSSNCMNSTSRSQEINIFADEDIKALVPQAISWTPRNRVKRVAVVDKKIIGRHGLKNQSHPIKIKPNPSNNEVVEEKTLYMIEPSTKNETEESTHPQNSVRTSELSSRQSSSTTGNNLKHEQEADETPIVPPLLVKMNMRRARNGTSSKHLSTSSTVSKGFKGLRPKRFGMVQRSETRSAPSSPSSSRCPSEPVHDHGEQKADETPIVPPLLVKMNTRREQEVDETPRVPPLLVKMNMRRARNGTSSKKIFTSSTTSKGFKGLRPKRFGMVQRSETRSAPSSPSSSRCPSEPVHDEHGGCTSGHDVKKSEKSKVEHKSKTRRMTLTDSKIGDCQSRKLKFRKGRMVELQTETITPRRLKFRRVRLLGETQSPKSDSRKRIIQGKEASQNGDELKEAENSENSFLRQQNPEIKRKKSFRRKETIDGKLVSSRIKSERIVLKHQDSKGKKEIQNLFNNVIEETATKLAQTRKSKVKALVGAFETVISLQDTRPTATVVA